MTFEGGPGALQVVGGAAEPNSYGLLVVDSGIMLSCLRSGATWGEQAVLGRRPIETPHQRENFWYGSFSIRITCYFSDEGRATVNLGQQHKGSFSPLKGPPGWQGKDDDHWSKPCLSPTSAINDWFPPACSHGKSDLELVFSGAGKMWTPDMESQRTEAWISFQM